MESKDELKEIDFRNRACYYFDDIIKDRDTCLTDTSLDKKLYENISVYSYKTSTNSKPLRIRFDKIDGFIRFRDYEFRRLLLFDYGLFDKICKSKKWYYR